MWQDMLDMPVLFENHASLTSLGAKQADFFKALIKETKVGLLFDFSNAYIAEYNQVALRETWDSLIQNTNHFHVAGFRIDETTKLALDTHDAPIAKAVVKDMQKYFYPSNHRKTLVVEFDAKVNGEWLKQNILRIKNQISSFDNLPINSVKSINKIEDKQTGILAKQNLHHRLFHNNPRLTSITNNGYDIFEPFLDWTDQKQLTMDWTLHLFLLNWLYQQEKWKNQITPEIAKELMISSVIGWSLSGFLHLHAEGIIVTAPCLPNIAILLWKNREASKTNKIIVLHYSEKIKFNVPCYALLHKYGELENLTWQPICFIQC